MAAEFNYIGKIRYEIYRKKHINVVWIDNSDKVMAVFELDGGNRKRSVKRLLEVSTY